VVADHTMRVYSDLLRRRRGTARGYAAGSV
jgi:hypothetical protein